MERLIVKNFGPLKDVDIELNKINLFIGENGSGKSVLGKILTIISDFDNFNEDEILKFEKYNINFISASTIIEFYSDNKLYLQLKNKKIIFDKAIQEVKNQAHKTFQEFEKFKNYITIFPEKKIDLSVQEVTKELEIFNKKYQKLKSAYIPAERNLISLFNKSLTTLLVAEVPLPKFLLSFSSEFEKAGNQLKELEFLDVKYVNGDGLDRHKVYFNDDNYLPLEHSSSGIQSALPLYLTVKYFANKHSSIIIEEPEQNLFPKAQTETIKYIVEQVSDENSLFMMTHSPYVLSTLNILMMAHKAGSVGEDSKEEVSKLINEKQWINPDDFSAYYLENGVARDIKGRTGLISDNEIDEISDDMTYAFEELLTIYREHKNDK
jgi:predicted ATPase